MANTKKKTQEAESLIGKYIDAIKEGRDPKAIEQVTQEIEKIAEEVEKSPTAAKPKVNVVSYLENLLKDVKAKEDEANKVVEVIKSNENLKQDIELDISNTASFKEEDDILSTINPKAEAPLDDDGLFINTADLTKEDNYEPVDDKLIEETLEVAIEGDTSGNNGILGTYNSQKAERALERLRREAGEELSLDYVDVAPEDDNEEESEEASTNETDKETVDEKPQDMKDLMNELTSIFDAVPSTKEDKNHAPVDKGYTTKKPSTESISDTELRETIIPSMAERGIEKAFDEKSAEYDPLSSYDSEKKLSKKEIKKLKKLKRKVEHTDEIHMYKETKLREKEEKIKEKESNSKERAHTHKESKTKSKNDLYTTNSEIHETVDNELKIDTHTLEVTNPSKLRQEFIQTSADLMPKKPSYNPFILLLHVFLNIFTLFSYGVYKKRKAKYNYRFALLKSMREIKILSGSDLPDELGTWSYKSPRKNPLQGILVLLTTILTLGLLPVYKSRKYTYINNKIVIEVLLELEKMSQK